MLQDAAQARRQCAAGLFNKFLKTSPFAELWRHYLKFIRSVASRDFLFLMQSNVHNPRATYTGSSAQMRDVVRKAYEFALNHIGHDKDCADVWTDYIQFFKAGEVRSLPSTGSTCSVSFLLFGKPASQWDESQKMDAIRKAYQRAVQIPMDNVKRLWEEYQEFENNLNKITVRGSVKTANSSSIELV